VELGTQTFDAALTSLRAVKMASLKTPEDAPAPKDEVAGVTHLRLVPAKTDLEPGEFCEVKCVVDFPKSARARCAGNGRQPRRRRRHRHVFRLSSRHVQPERHGL